MLQCSRPKRSPTCRNCRSVDRSPDTHHGQVRRTSATPTVRPTLKARPVEWCRRICRNVILPTLQFGFLHKYSCQLVGEKCCLGLLNIWRGSGLYTETRIRSCVNVVRYCQQICCYHKWSASATQEQASPCRRHLHALLENFALLVGHMKQMPQNAAQRDALQVCFSIFKTPMTMDQPKCSFAAEAEAPREFR